MATQKASTAANNDIQSLFDPKRYDGAYKVWAQTGERMIGIAVETGIRSTEITSTTTKEALSNLREAATVRADVAGYGKAQAALVQKQVELFARSAQALGALLQSAGSETSAVATEAGETLGSKVAANVEGVANKASAASKKAA